MKREVYLSTHKNLRELNRALKKFNKTIYRVNVSYGFSYYTYVMTWEDNEYCYVSCPFGIQYNATYLDNNKYLENGINMMCLRYKKRLA